MLHFDAMERTTARIVRAVNGLAPAAAIVIDDEYLSRPDRLPLFWNRFMHRFIDPRRGYAAVSQAFALERRRLEQAFAAKAARLKKLLACESDPECLGGALAVVAAEPAGTDIAAPDPPPTLIDTLLATVTLSPRAPALRLTS